MAKKAKAKKKNDDKKRRTFSLGQTAMSFVSDIESVELCTGFNMTVNGLDVVGHPSYEECEQAGRIIRIKERGIQFALGDFINYVEDNLGEAAAQIIDFETGWSKKTVDVYRWLAKRVKKANRRMDRLGIGHHILVAPLSEAKQKHWLNKAAGGEDERPWTVAHLKEAIEVGGDREAIEWWVQVLTSGTDDQNALMAQLEGQGRKVKAITRKALAPSDTVEPTD